MRPGRLRYLFHPAQPCGSGEQLEAFACPRDAFFCELPLSPGDTMTKSLDKTPSASHAQSGQMRDKLMRHDWPTHPSASLASLAPSLRSWRTGWGWWISFPAIGSCMPSAALTHTSQYYSASASTPLFEAIQHVRDRYHYAHPLPSVVCILGNPPSPLLNVFILSKTPVLVVPLITLFPFPGPFR
jgi:hypothetical protein